MKIRRKNQQYGNYKAIKKSKGNLICCVQGKDRDENCERKINFI